MIVFAAIAVRQLTRRTETNKFRGQITKTHFQQTKQNKTEKKKKQTKTKQRRQRMDTTNELDDDLNGCRR